MPGDAAMGSVLRELRRSRNLSMAAVAKQVNCAESLISYVETGKREIQPWLAEKLDAVYGTGGAVVALTISHDERSRASIEPGSTAKAARR
ncbi:helix-turn-helix transcriptional regulator [Nocardia terpenica]|uniref:helix-turn-helix transcriptional regulator n=1 Tax=Nocardia terpenica TaxID=455432 RepID=UPI0012FE015D|nr:helix-turn-helix transcriptional regulator [Nocardia terpenica]